MFKICPHLMNAATKRPTNRHADWPSKLDGRDVRADSLTVFCIGQTFQPYPHRLDTCFGPEEDCRYAFAFCTHALRATGSPLDSTTRMYHIRYTIAKQM